MPSEPGPADLTSALGAALASLREGAGSGVDDALDLFPVTGDRDTQRALDTYLEQLADLLREVEASAGELEATLRIAGCGRVRPTGVGASAPDGPGAPLREDVSTRRSR
ncbi:hypothetical protein [Knoellia koreensis]|uniref:Uncharacterized protein n=1 Tax=Knoellia koreensis TaxID=2730921 RepID=A0A849HEE2_9MICO|nr:hypothetical protein [Knoellia sp. DB2414S]NNM46305.1 hypothetical protein [Knoellia sp. DB2414S]